MQHPRMSVRREDASKGEAVLVPLTQDAATGLLRDDHSQAPLLVPLTLLGCRVEVEVRSPGDAYTSATYEAMALQPACGGEKLHTLIVHEGMFDESMMEAEEVAFEDMKLPQLKAELAMRGARRTGLKAALQRRLHALLIEAYVRDGMSDAEMGEDEEAEGHAVSRKALRPSVPHRTMKRV